MPYKNATTRRKTNAKSARDQRSYHSAVIFGEPKALAAEEAKDYMKPFNDLRIEKDKLSPEERTRLQSAGIDEPLSRKNLMRVHDLCVTNRKNSQFRYLKLRKEAITEWNADPRNKAEPNFEDLL